MKKILIVEDDQVVASAYQRRFVKAGFIVEVAEDGLEGLQLATAAKPDVVLLDLLMPRLDGLEMLKYIRTHPDLASLPVVVFSNSYMTNLVENAWRAGANQCLMKASTTPAEVIDAVNKVLFGPTPQALAAAPRA
jgi:CheY-like chemotaxis protein